MSHSKRNTSRAVFTSYERTLAKAAWGTNTARLSRDSFLPFASCRLCLLPARTPVSCPHGDIFCKECALKNILSQKQEIKRLKLHQGREQKEAEEKREQDEAEARLRYAAEFERVQMGLESKSTITKSVEQNKEDWENTANSENIVRPRGEKRKFQLDPEEVMRIAQSETNKVKKAIYDEKASRPKLPSFWAPSITPTSNTKNKLHHIPKKDKLFPICPASQIENPHIYSLHSLIEIVFTEEVATDSGGTQRICPTCKKAFTNTSKAMLIKNCGHVLCKNCASKLITKSGTRDLCTSNLKLDTIFCFVCNTDIYGEDKVTQKRGNKNSKKEYSENTHCALIEIRCEGTGFASGGVSTVEKSGVVFQC
ncbi:E3 ubiquitin-protein ligase CSU1 [Erysiphe necator]|uniref:Putative ring finger domain-containing protein n=1 Tax=Uncinula necator TaxID=52586 RepID=A0A0B1NVZ4_UNCNE|nr:E3 ubiquitin-protein ligase CSU1 [Erysiphe necator]KHJ30552.1 putative ring finger domain-containing protein [Erysiphe necator]